MDTEQRFLDKINYTKECWVWTATRTEDGYGRFWFQGRMTASHRVAHLLYIGPIPAGFHVDHLCKNRACVNPQHLEAVTPQENHARSDAGAHNSAKEACPRGHRYTAENTLRSNARQGRKCRMCRL